MPVTTVVHLELRISPRIFENFKRPYRYIQGLGGNWFVKKTWSRESRGTVPLMRNIVCRRRSEFSLLKGVYNENYEKEKTLQVFDSVPLSFLNLSVDLSVESPYGLQKLKIRMLFDMRQRIDTFLKNCFNRFEISVKFCVLYLTKIFFQNLQICHRCQRHRLWTLSCEYLREFSKISNGPNGILSAWGETDSWKKSEAKNFVTLSLYCNCTLKLQVKLCSRIFCITELLKDV